MILGALAFISNNAQFFFQKVLFGNISDMDHAIKSAVKMQSDLLTTAVIVTLIVTLFSGALSDRWGRRSINVMGGLFSAAGAWVFLSIRNVTWVDLFGLPITDLLVAGGLIGIGMGLFTSANWAWAVDLTPPDQAARFLGLTNIATAGATVVTSLFGPIISLLNMQSAGAGFTFMFTLSIIGFILGALMLFKVRDTHQV
jgi:MFS family permease